MSTREAYRPKDYARAAADIIALLPQERAMEVYDFARFLQAQESEPPKPPENADEWLNDTEEQMAVEDVAWEATYRQHRDEFLALRETAQAEIDAGKTRPMFDEHGNLES
jgi:hypothetical protein